MDTESERERKRNNGSQRERSVTQGREGEAREAREDSHGTFEQENNEHQSS